jgi:hypothetical protein
VLNNLFLWIVFECYRFTIWLRLVISGECRDLFDLLTLFQVDLSLIELLRRMSCHRELVGSESRRRGWVPLPEFVLLSREDTQKMSSDRGCLLLNPYPIKNHPNILRYMNCVSQNASCSDELHRICSCRPTEFRNIRLTVHLSHLQSYRVFYTSRVSCVPETARTPRGWLRHGLTVGYKESWFRFS